ncbi:hypothetical protein ACHHYP_04677 [Achlya hypogyna]|uniref:CAP-Gly domain-containing protein n=1 Tax=Achlya hypogyna TaxID=1202772 RepID=A0A1V9Z0I9_ACHHY|nr:hypothetical protein ACHHYP_04677 [Achlya hypogyna]
MNVTAGESVLALYAAQFLKAREVPESNQAGSTATDGEADDDVADDCVDDVADEVVPTWVDDATQATNFNPPPKPCKEALLRKETPVKLMEPDTGIAAAMLQPSEVPQLVQSLRRAIADQKQLVASLMSFTGSLSHAPMAGVHCLTTGSIQETAEYMLELESGHSRLSMARTTHVLAQLALQSEAAVQHLVSTIGGHTPAKPAAQPTAPRPASPWRRASRKPSFASTLEQIGGSFREFLYAPQVEESLCSPRTTVEPAPAPVAPKAGKRKKLPRRLLGRSVILFNGMVGTVRFAGSTEFANGTMYGIELNEPHGKHTGTVNGTTYFTCAKNSQGGAALPYGVFVRETQIKSWL